jgi:NAD(P)-dependent dehydrogenase (short-subunit alcohol dehydrogenase family)
MVVSTSTSQMLDTSTSSKYSFSATAATRSRVLKSDMSRNINDVSSKQLNGMLDVMTKGVFYAVKHGSRAMAVTSSTKSSSGGAIVATTSVAGMNGKFADLPYCNVPSPQCMSVYS